MKIIAFILSRMQPFHNGHRDLISKVLKNHDSLTIVIGSADKSKTERNPFDIVLRKEILMDYLMESHGDRVIKIICLDDLSSEDEPSEAWGEYLLKHVKEANPDSFRFEFYTSENPHDMVKWFSKITFDGLLSLHCFTREANYNNSNYILSATLIRDLIIRAQDITEYVPRATKSRYGILREILLNITN